MKKSIQKEKLDANAVAAVFSGITASNNYLVSREKYAKTLSDKAEEGLLVSVVVSGAEGGNCWGDSASSFTKSSEDREQDLADEISSALYGLREFSGLKQAVLTYVEGKGYSSDYDYSENEYYGNYRDYGVYFVSFADIWSILESAKCVEEQVSFNEVMDLFKNSDSTARNSRTAERFKLELNDVQSKLKNFEKTSEQRKAQLLASIKQYEKALVQMQSQLKNFDEACALEKKQLGAKCEELVNQLKGLV